MSTNTATTANMPGTPGQPMPQPTCPAPSGYQQYARQSKRARRKPAGPLLVLVTLGLALLAIAGSGWYAITMPVDWDYALRVLRLATLCCGGICLGIGVVIVVLGCMGRRPASAGMVRGVHGRGDDVLHECGGMGKPRLDDVE